jgi:hypothetical protein
MTALGLSAQQLQPCNGCELQPCRYQEDSPSEGGRRHVTAASHPE